MEAEVRQALMQAHDEIISLRARLGHVEQKAHAYDTIAQIAALSIREPTQGFSMDVAWRIETLLEKADKPQVQEEEQTNG